MLDRDPEPPGRHPPPDANDIARDDFQREFSRVASDGDPDGRAPFAPPAEPCECYCLHCQRTFMSDGIWFQRIVGRKGREHDGFWMCPTPNCGGAGFTFDIFPTDPGHPANDGWTYCDDEDGGDDEEARSGNPKRSMMQTTTSSPAPTPRPASGTRPRGSTPRSTRNSATRARTSS